MTRKIKYLFCVWILDRKTVTWFNDKAINVDGKNVPPYVNTKINIYD